jgi:hypothetical protein
MCSPLPVPISARITKYLNKYVRRGLCLIYISSFYFWSPPTFWGIIHVCQAILETGSGRKLSHNGCTAGNFDLPDHGFPLPMAARITKYLTKYVRRGICLIYMSRFYFWSPPLGRKMRKTNMPSILTYPTMAFYFWLAPRVLWNDLWGIVIKQRHWQTFWGIIYVDQATLRTGSCLLRS